MVWFAFSMIRPFFFGYEEITDFQRFFAPDLLLFGTGCGTTMLSDEYLANKAKGQFAQMKKAEKISSNASHKAMVNRIGNRISRVAPGRPSRNRVGVRSL